MNQLVEIPIASLVSSVFTKTPHESLSENYIHIPTSVLVTDMIKLGWKPCESNQINSKKKSGYQKHVVKFFNPDLFIQKENGSDVDIFPQILIFNSHDGSSSFQFRTGLYRLACSNGLIVSTHEIEKFKIRHMGYNFENLRVTLNTMTEKLPTLINKINQFKSISLTEPQINDFAKKSWALRFDKKYLIDSNNITKSVRKDDEGNDLWNVFNRVQENLIKGGFKIVNTENNKVRVIKKVRSFVNDIKLNEDLWELAETYTK